MKYVTSASGPKPIGHYAHGVEHNGVLYVSGQLPLDPATGKVAGVTAAEQAERALQNIALVLAAGGSAPERVLKVTVYLCDFEQRAQVNAAYAKFFGAHTPARATIPICPLPNGMLVEIDAIAAVGA
jgi:2-iminobutanoate/2-iminopropanoate deaminase